MLTFSLLPFQHEDQEFAGFVTTKFKGKEVAGFIGKDKSNLRKLGETAHVADNAAATAQYDQTKEVRRRSCCFHDADQPVNSLFLSTDRNTASGGCTRKETRDNVTRI